MRLRFAPRATRDLVEIAEYLRARNPYAAERVRTAILDSLQTVVCFREAAGPKPLQMSANW